MAKEKHVWTCDTCLKESTWDKGARQAPKWRWYFMGDTPIQVFCSDECDSCERGMIDNWPKPQNVVGVSRA